MVWRSSSRCTNAYASPYQHTNRDFSANPN